MRETFHSLSAIIGLIVCISCSEESEVTPNVTTSQDKVVKQTEHNESHTVTTSQEKVVKLTEHNFSVKFPEKIDRIKILESHTKWEKSLVTNLGHTGNSYLFVATKLPLLEKGVMQKGKIYQTSSVPSQFLVMPNSGYAVIIDRAKKEVGTMGIGGVTLHPHPGKEIVVCLEPSPGTGIIGIPLSDSKTEVIIPPIFTENSVSWSWGK